MLTLLTALVVSLWPEPFPADRRVKFQPRVKDTVRTPKGDGVVVEVDDSPFVKSKGERAAYVVGNGWADWVPLVKLAVLQ